MQTERLTDERLREVEAALFDSGLDSEVVKLAVFALREPQAALAPGTVAVSEAKLRTFIEDMVARMDDSTICPTGIVYECDGGHCDGKECLAHMLAHFGLAAEVTK
jgi:hypothetical protein